MRITIAPTRYQDHFAGDPASIQHAVTVEIPFDDIGLEQAIELMANALKAYGFPAKSVDEYLAPR